MGAKPSISDHQSGPKLTFLTCCVRRILF